jgi:hypothetical protein
MKTFVDMLALLADAGVGSLRAQPARVLQRRF